MNESLVNRINQRFSEFPFRLTLPALSVSVKSENVIDTDQSIARPADIVFLVAVVSDHIRRNF
jgi:hypothetical protein